MQYESISYWQQTSEEIPLSTDLPLIADIAVIDGGLLGSATTYWLARSGAQEGPVQFLQNHSGPELTRVYR